jgi:hypothetical protein
VIAQHVDDDSLPDSQWPRWLVINQRTLRFVYSLGRAGFVGSPLTLARLGISRLRIARDNLARHCEQRQPAPTRKFRHGHAAIISSKRQGICSTPLHLVNAFKASLADRALLVEVVPYRLFCRGGGCPAYHQPCSVDDEVRLRQLDVMVAAGRKHLWRRRH